MADPSEALQIALYERLTAELTVPVYDAVPMDTPYPYVTIDSEISSDQSPISGKKRDLRLIYLSVWSNYQGKLEVKRINAQIVAALHLRDLPLEEGRAVEVRVTRAQANREPDGRTYQGSVTVSIITTN
ncbi:DUF3168 domain-containing protein [Pseudomonas luteola]